jgi:hypothetical protein
MAVPWCNWGKTHERLVLGIGTATAGAPLVYNNTVSNYCAHTIMAKFSLVCVTWFERWVPALRKNLLPPFSRQKMEAVCSSDTWSECGMPWLRKPRHERVVPWFNISFANFSRRGPVNVWFVVREVVLWGLVFEYLYFFPSLGIIVPKASCGYSLTERKNAGTHALTAGTLQNAPSYWKWKIENRENICSYCFIVW